MEYYNGKDKIFMREHVGDVNNNAYGVKTLSRALNGAPVIEFEDGSMVVFPWSHLIKQAIECREKENTNV